VAIRSIDVGDGALSKAFCHLNQQVSTDEEVLFLPESKVAEDALVNGVTLTAFLFAEEASSKGSL
jgi:hypothetical protein